MRVFALAVLGNISKEESAINTSQSQQRRLWRNSLLVLLILFSLAIILSALTFWSVLSQEEHPFSILKAIVRLHFEQLDYSLIEQTGEIKRYISKNLSGNRFEIIENYMDDRGWQLQEQLGSVLIFEKEDIRIGISTRQFTRHYLLWDAPVLR